MRSFFVTLLLNNAIKLKKKKNVFQDNQEMLVYYYIKIMFILPYKTLSISLGSYFFLSYSNEY